jgi:hypothetical protein
MWTLAILKNPLNFKVGNGIGTTILNLLKPKKILPDHYSGELNYLRIKEYRKICKEYNVSESTVRDIFCKGADWYKSVLEKDKI